MKALIWLAFAVWAQEPGPEAILAEGDRLAAEKEYDRALLRWRDAYQLLVPRLRGLDLRKPVEAGLLDREGLRDEIRRALDEELPEEKRRFLDRSLKVFGFVPPTLSVERLVLDLYTEEVAGFYDPRRKKLFLVHETEEDERPRGFLERLLGSSGGFDPDEQKIALAHEMAHALADQHYDLDALDRASPDDDTDLALAALIEGEATLVMIAETMRESGGAAQALKMSPRTIDWTFRLLRPFLPYASGKAFRDAPRIFRESLLFPYVQGTVFLLHATNRGGWKPVDAAFRDPPRSTEQVLHPEKYFGAERDEPERIEVPALDGALEGEWKEVGRNVLGELQLSVLLDRAAAAGWDGDRYVVLEDAAGRVALAWITAWDSPDEAGEFARSCRRARPEWTIRAAGTRVAAAAGASAGERTRLVERLLERPEGRLDGVPRDR